jgi:hypothetical protein
MKSKNEEYLDSLLNSLKKDANSGIAQITNDSKNTSDLNDVIGNSSGSNDLNEIGEMLGKIDSGQLLDEGMVEVLDSISAPIDSDAPTYKVGDEVSDSYEKDVDEIALDEEIALAEAALENAGEVNNAEVASEIPDVAMNNLGDDINVDIPDIPSIEEITAEATTGATQIGEAEETNSFDDTPSLEASTGMSDDDLMNEVAIELPTDAPDSLLEVAPEIPIDDFSDQSEAGQMSSADSALDEMMRATPEEVLGADFGAQTTSDENLLNIDEMLDAGTGSEEAAIDDALSLEGFEDIGSTASEAGSSELSVDEGQGGDIPDDAFSLEGLLDGEPTIEDTAGEQVGDPSLDEINIDEISIDGISIDGISAEEPSLDEINIDGMMEEAPAEATAEPSLDEINIDAMMADAPEAQEASEAPVADMPEATAEPSLDEINIDAMMADAPEAQEAAEAPAADMPEAVAEPSLDEINIDAMMADAPEVQEVSEAPVADMPEVAEEPSIDGINIDQVMADASAAEMAEAEAEPSIDEINIDEMMAGEPEVQEVSEAPAIDMPEVAAEPSLDEINIDEMLAEEPSADEVPMDDETLKEEPLADEISLEDMPLEENGVDDSSIEEVMGEEAASGDGAPAEEAPAEAAPSDEVVPDELLELDQLQIDKMLSGDDLDENSAGAEGGSNELGLDDLSLDDLDLSLDSPDVPEEAGEGADGAGDEVSLESMSAELDNLLDDVGEDAGGAEDSLEGEAMSSESELDSMLADLGGEEGADGGEPGDVDMPDLDAIMNSLASDDVEDLENTAHIDEQEGANAGEISLDDIGIGPDDSGEEVNPEDIMEALEGDGLDEIGLSDDIPDPDEVNDNGGDYDEISLFDGPDEASEDEEGGKKKKKKKRPNLLILIIAALFKVLTQTDEDLNPKSEEDGLASLTDENQQVIDELAAEDGKKAKKEKKKKEKKEKPKKEPKPKKEKKPKPPKEPKPKKEKKKKVDDGAPEKALAPKKVAISMIFATSLGLLCCLPSFVLPGRIIFTRAQTAFENGDYSEAYKLLYGKELNEEQALLYHKARVMACANHYMDSYNNYLAMNMKDEAVDSLLVGMRTKDAIIKEAEEFQVAGEVESVYSNIESILTGEYGLSAADIEEVNKLTDKAAYTKRIMEIAGTLEDFIHPTG